MVGVGYRQQYQWYVCCLFSVVTTSTIFNTCHRLVLNKSETRMTAGVLKEDPNSSKAEKNAYLKRQNTKCDISGKPPFKLQKKKKKKKRKKT